MGKFERFEDIVAWQKSRDLARLIYGDTNQGTFSKDYGLKDQIRRAVVSISSNIAEGFERNGNKEFVQFLSQAKGSCGEVRSQLYVALDQQYISSDTFEDRYQRSIEISRLLSGLIRSLNASSLKGRKYIRESSPPYQLHATPKL